MTVLLLVVLPLLAEGSLVEVPPSYCALPAASTEKFDYSPAGKTWYVQYQYRVPGYSDLGCLAYRLSHGNVPNELHLTGNFSKITAFPVEAHIRIDGNRYNKVFHGKFTCSMSGPSNMVYLHNDFFITHFCWLGFDVSQILTTAKEPSERLMERIWKAVDDHPEVDRRKYRKVVC